MAENETTIDRLLKIRTTGRDDSNSNQFKYPYEPTPYVVLGRLANSGEITKANTLLDYGCGKGRVDYYLAYQTRCRAIGVEYDVRIFNTAMANHETAISRNRVTLENENAEDYEVPAEVDRCFFFNPFSVEILAGTLGRILESYYENPREMYLFFYYPSDEFIGYLMGVAELEFEDEINCQDIFDGDNIREQVLVFSVNG